MSAYECGEELPFVPIETFDYLFRASYSASLIICACIDHSLPANCFLLLTTYWSYAFLKGIASSAHKFQSSPLLSISFPDSWSIVYNFPHITRTPQLHSPCLSHIFTVSIHIGSCTFPMLPSFFVKNNHVGWIITPNHVSANRLVSLSPIRST